MAKAKESIVVEINPIKMRRIIVNLVGTTPLIMHRFARKTWEEMLYPSRKKNKSEKESSLKHKPLEEYRECFYHNRNPKDLALFHLPNEMVHGTLASAALDIPGATKASMERLTSVVNPNVSFFGVPQLCMRMVRNSDMNHTPDVRTRPFFPRWACTVEIEYKCDPLTDNQILNLLGAAGMIVGLGDWRPQKGGRYGKFRIASAKDKEFLRIVSSEGRVAQQRAYDKPDEYDEETAELMSWFNEEVARRRQDDSDVTAEAAE